MMNVYKFTAYIYAEEEQAVKDMEQAMIDFVNEHRDGGRAVTADRVTKALRSWKDNVIVRTRIIKYFE